MHIAILFYSDTLAMTAETQGIKGRAIANNGFMHAIFQNLKEDTITLFVTSLTEKEWIEELWHGKISQNVQILTFSQMSDFFEKNTIDILHVLGPDLYRALLLRQQLENKTFAVTGITHSLGHAPFQEWMYLNLLASPQPHDRLICTTPTAETAILKIAEQTSRTLSHEKKLPTSIIPLGISLADLQRPAPPLRNALKIPESAVVFLSLGRFSYYTKADLAPLLFAFREALKKTTQDLRLILAGAAEDPDYPALLKTFAENAGIEKQVLILPNPQEEQKRSLYQMADIFVALGDNPQETFGLSVVEAMASGLPVIASEWDGYRALVLPHKTGVLVSTLGLKTFTQTDFAQAIQLDSLNHLFISQSVATDLKKLTEAILVFAGDAPQRAEFAKQARAKAEAYDWKKIIAAYRGLWEELSKEAKKAPSDHSPKLATLHYRSVFSHYPTELIDASMVFARSTRGNELLEGKAELRLYTILDEILIPTLMQKILLQLSQPLSLKKVCENLNAEQAESVTYHLIWLYKYGFLERKESARA